MIHYDLKAVISKLSIVVIALLSLTIGGTMTSHTHVSAHSVKRVRPYKAKKEVRRHHTKGVNVKRVKRTRRNNQTQKPQRPMRIEHRYTSKDPISIGPKNSKKK